MKVAVIGVGGVGGYFGARLAALQLQAGDGAKVEVHFVARGETLQSLRREGLRVESILGDVHIPPDRCRATDDIAAIGQVDLVLVTVKTWQLEDVARTLKPLLHRDTIVLPLQNGVESADILATCIDKHHILGGYCKIVSYIVKPAHIRHEAIEPVIGFGEIWRDEATNSIKSISDRVRKLKTLFESARVKVDLHDDIRVGIWQKFMIICGLSGVGAITRAPQGVFLALEETRELFRQVLYEVGKLAQVQNIDLPDETIDKVYNWVQERVKSDPNSTSSMQRDLMRGLPSELEWQVGAVVRISRALGVATPVCSFIYAALLPQEMKARAKLTYSIE